MPENVTAQPNVVPTPPVPSAVDKFPDPTEQNVPSAQVLIQTNQQSSTQLVNKKFWRVVLILLVLLPIVTAVLIFGYQIFLTQSLSRQTVSTPPVQIDANQVVTPIMLPSGNTNGVPVGWQIYTHPSAGFSFGYPQGWVVDEADLNHVQLKTPTTVTDLVTIIFSVLPTDQSVTTTEQLQLIAKAQDERQGLKIGVATESAKVSASGLAIYQREIAKGSNLLLYPEVFVALDKKVLQVSTEGNIASQLAIFDQVIHSISASTVDPTLGLNQWQSYENSFGYSLKYPANVTLKSNDKNAPDVSKSTNILIFPTAEIQSSGGFSSLLAMTLSDTQPAESATQSATRDFGIKEFKAYESAGRVQYVGQLSSGNWLQIALNYDSNIEVRKLLNQIIDTITLKDTPQP
ncbi:MAG: hypothetical protein ABI425_05725 [Patescibacteria group bacterium]